MRGRQRLIYFLDQRWERGKRFSAAAVFLPSLASCLGTLYTLNADCCSLHSSLPTSKLPLDIKEQVHPVYLKVSDLSDEYQSQHSKARDVMLGIPRGFYFAPCRAGRLQIVASCPDDTQRPAIRNFRRLIDARSQAARL